MKIPRRVKKWMKQIDFAHPPRRRHRTVRHHLVLRWLRRLRRRYVQWEETHLLMRRRSTVGHLALAQRMWVRLLPPQP